MIPISADPTQFFPSIQKLTEKQSQKPVAPTLVIGIGTTGYVVLAGLKKLILDENRNQLPDSLQLLWIGHPDQTSIAPGLAELGEYEQIVIEPNIEQANRIVGQNREQYNYLSWWTPGQRSNQRSRGNGRFSLFWLLYFENQVQRLSDVLKHANIKLGGNSETRYRVFYITNLLEPISAILIDLAHLVRQALPPQKIKFHIPFLLLNNDGENIPDEQKAGIVAALRELERFMSGREQLLSTGTLSRSVVTQNFLFDYFMAFDKPQSQAYLPDLLYTLLQPEIADKFNQSLVNRSGDELSAQFLFSNAAIFTYLLPIAEIRRVCAIRLLQDELFSTSRSGGFGTLGQFPPASFVTGKLDDFASLAKSFLRDDRRQFGTQAFPLDVLANASDRNWSPSPGQTLAFSNLVEMFQSRLTIYLNQVMYTSRSESLAIRPYGILGWVQEFLKALRNIISEAGLFLGRYRNSPVAKDLVSQLGELRSTLEIWAREVERWQKAIDQIHLRVNQTLIVEQKSLQKSSQDTLIRQIPLDKSNMDLDVAYPYYQDFIHQGAGIRARNDIRNRTGWVWRPHSDPEKTRLHWVVFGPDENLENWSSALHSYQPDDLDKAFYRLVAIAEIYAQQIGQEETIINLLRNTHSSEIVQPFRTPRFLLETLPGQSPLRVTDYYLAGMDQEQIMKWASQNRLVELSQHTIKIDDPTRVIYMAVDRNLPKSAMKFMDENFSRYYRDPGLHVFLEEQAAVQLEREYGLTEMLHPRLVRLMNDLPAFKVAMRCVLFGWVRENFDGLRKTWAIEAPGIPEPIILDNEAFPKINNLESALAMFLVFLPNASLNSGHQLYKGHGRFSGTIRSLQNACDTHQDLIKQKPAQEKQNWCNEYQRKIENCLDSPDDFLHSLGLVLKNVFSRENL